MKVISIAATPEAASPSQASAWNSSFAKWLSLGALFLLCLPLYFFRLGGWAFFDADEGRYGEIPRAMLATGDYITPMLNGVKFFDKPPLLYWGIAFFYQLLGINEGAARLVPALAAVGAVFGAWALGRRMYGPRAGFLSGVILATSFVWPAMGRVVLTDMLVSSLTFMAVAFWWLGRTAPDAKSRNWLNFGFWTALGFGVLAKGPIACLLAFGTISFYVLLSGQWKSLKGMGWLPGVVWLLAIAAPWFTLVQLRNPEFFKAFWIDQNFGRFLGVLAEQDHANGPLYFVEFLPIIFFPWTVFAPAAIVAGWKKLWPGRGKQRSEKGLAALYLVCGVIFPVLFFSSSSSKLVTYILPVVPLMAVALAGYFEWYWQHNGARWNRILLVGVMALAVVALAAGIGGAIAGPRALEKLGASGTPALMTSVGFLVWGVALVVASLKYRLKGAVAATALGFTLVLTLATGIAAAIGPRLTTPQLLAKIRPGLDAGGEIVSFGFTQSLSFYTGKRIVMVDRPDEIRSGISYLSEQEQKKWFLKGDADLQPYLQKTSPVYFLLRTSRRKAQEDRDRILALGGDFEPVTGNARYTFFGNPAARRITPPDDSVKLD